MIGSAGIRISFQLEAPRRQKELERRGFTSKVEPTYLLKWLSWSGPDHNRGPDPKTQTSEGNSGVLVEDFRLLCREYHRAHAS